jgi:transcriptional regulator with XRE-family HTH domain
MNDSLGARIRRARTAAGLSQATLARHIGISGTSLSAIERGTVPDPGALRIRAIAQVLHVSADYLLGLVDVPLPLLQSRAPVQPYALPDRCQLVVS